MSHCRRRIRAGFSLIELIAAVAVAGILLAGATSFVAFYARWSSVLRQRSEATTALMLSLERLHLELSQARAIRQKTATVIEFDHPDVTGDGEPDVIRWEWSGVEGEPLIRTVNPGLQGMSAEPASPPLKEFALEYWVQTKSVPVEVAGIRTTETHDYLVLVLATARDTIEPGGRLFRRAVVFAAPLDVTGL